MLRLITAALVVAALAALAPMALGAYNPGGGTDGATRQSGTSFDTADANTGGWDRTTATVANRPYIAYLGITNPGFPEVTVIDNRVVGSATPPVQQIGGGQFSDIYAFVSPTNACNTTQTPTPGVCYANPNRVTVSLAAQTGASTWTENMTSTSTVPNVTASSEIRLIVAFRAAYSSLRWTWVNGTPTYWRSTVIPGQGGTVEVKFSPKTMPWMTGGAGCSAIPVSTCDIQQASAEQLMPQMILSMDDTLEPGLAGVLFGSAGAFIGSLESSPIGQGQAPTLTYGIAAPHLNADGSDRRGTFYALIPETILSLFGTGVAAFDQSILAVERTNGSGTFSIGWSPWNATANGTAGQFLTITDISFSAPKFEVKRRAQSPGGGTGTAPGPSKARPKPTVKTKKTISLTRLAQSFNVAFGAGAKLSAKVSTPKVCKVVKTGIQGVKPGTCRATLRVKPKTGKTTTQAVSFQIVK